MRHLFLITVLNVQIIVTFGTEMALVHFPGIFNPDRIFPE